MTTSATASAAKRQPPKLGNDAEWELLKNDHRVLVRQRTTEGSKTSKTCQWTTLSSAVRNGGLKRFSQPLQILNSKVPADYDGVHPDPKELLGQLAQKEQQDDNVERETVGLLTAASMETVSVATQQATGQLCGQTVVVDVIVTAGISNARVGGAKSDVFFFLHKDDQSRQNNHKDKKEVTKEDSDDKESTSKDSPAAKAEKEDRSDDKEDTTDDREPNTTEEDTPKPKKEDEPQKSPPFGTINTIVVVNAVLEESSTAMVEAYAVAIEAKCRAANELGIVCAKDPTSLATGTGTDSTVLVCQQDPNDDNRLLYAGKHMLLGELIGQAVYQATRDAIDCNLRYFYGKYSPLSPRLCYRLRVRKLQILQALRQGHRPLVPDEPMKPMEGPKGWVLGVGLFGLALSFGIYLYTLQPRCKPFLHLPSPTVGVLFSVVWVDRFLGSLFMPLSIHPVVLVGNLITKVLGWIPESHFGSDQPVQGFLSGFLLFLAVVTISLTTAWGLLLLPNLAASGILAESQTCSVNSGFWFYPIHFVDWFFQVFILRGALSLQLLCSIGLQMADFLERHQLKRARDQLVWLCSRDPSKLEAHELAGGTLESISENLSDSLVSPLVYYVWLGPVGAIALRIMNGLDSRVGYRGRYEWVGKVSAKWDDLIHLLPARLTALFLAVAAALVRRAPEPAAADVAQQGLRVAWRDARQCESPNAGWPMATLAGLLGVCLEKREHYSLNGGARPPNHHDIRRGHAIVEVAGYLSFVVAMVAIWLTR